jgi:hypothetical protein
MQKGGDVGVDIEEIAKLREEKKYLTDKLSDLTLKVASTARFLELCAAETEARKYGWVTPEEYIRSAVGDMESAARNLRSWII